MIQKVIAYMLIWIVNPHNIGVLIIGIFSIIDNTFANSSSTSYHNLSFVWIVILGFIIIK